MTASSRIKVLVFSQDVIGSSMAGPGIRSWEFASALAKHHAVTLAAPNQPDVTSKAFAITSYAQQSVSRIIPGHHVIITQVISPAMAYLARKHGIKIILDAYDPQLLEALEIYHRESPRTQRHHNHRFLTETNLSLHFADAIICASEKQRDLWLGALQSLGHLTPSAYKIDPTLRRLIDVVPFGLRAHDPEPAAPDSPAAGFRAKYGIKPSDTVLLWAGGIYEWYDTPTLLHAMAAITKRRADIKLVFLGLKHPNAGVNQADPAARAKQLSDDLGLTGRTVFFNFGWIPYADWPGYLLETDIGLSTHFDHLETRFSFRTRVIDSYLWGLKPIITTQGDAMADLVHEHGLGRTVPYEDTKALAAAITELADSRTEAGGDAGEPKGEYAAIQSRLRTLRDQYRWPEVIKPVETLIAHIATQPTRRYTWPEIKLIFRMYLYVLDRLRTERGLTRTLATIPAKFAHLIFKRS